VKKSTRILASLAGLAVVAAGLTVAAGPASAAEARAAVQPRIVGGHAASIQYPIGVWNACTVILIKPDWLLTAAHCTWKVEYVAIGTDRTKPVATSSTDRRLFYAGPGTADVALLHLATPVTNVKPVLIARGSPAVGTPTRIVGFGQTCPTVNCGGSTNVAQEADTSIVADSKCPVITEGDRELCTNNPGKAGACYGDSGGPQLMKTHLNEWILVGVTSGWGTANTDCGAAPSIYTDVTEKGGVRQWIAQTVGGLTNAR
jgi:secreted trypsin-like serine protease